MALVEVKVPDIGDFKEVEVIELLVKVGDTVTAEQSLITVESDKASMEIPSSHAGVVKELKVKIGDKVAEGSLVLMVEVAAADSVPLAKGGPGKGSSADAEATPATPSPAQISPPPQPSPLKGEAARPPAVLFLERRCRGFTLVEVLVALTIVAVTLGAGLKAAGALTSTAQRLADVTAAQWCADNALVGLRLAKQFPGTGDADFACHQLGRDYAGRLLTRGTPNPSFRRVDAVVRDSQGHVLVTLSTVIGRY